ncbi:MULTISPECIES: general stress protein B [Staphylococcus]|uniref:General stress protein B n=1 Tax=Staphylococcus cohnii TaxID=29382 RepID=A0ABT6J4I0_9STAP|nr:MULTISPECIES: general stress protein B [Staphylococcus]MDH5140532.1 general stress protein B [Staphylococcus cohnii]MDH5159058.1 general stress protein B [Staphylococcus cohnii]MDH5170116.1 general stress protein B [Staphylococcus cohnii]MDK9850177.1 general stress protein B [Staphylococcus equorum]
MAEKDKNKDAMTTSEAGQKGGETTSQEHDKEFYEDIDQKGGKSNSQNKRNNK